MLKTSNHWLSKTQVDYIPSVVLPAVYKGNHTDADMVPRTATLLLFGILLTTRGGAIVAPPDIVAGALHSAKGRQAEEPRDQEPRHLNFLSHSFQHGPILGAFQVSPFPQGDWTGSQNVAQNLGTFGSAQQPTSTLFTNQLSAPNHQTNTVIIKGRENEAASSNTPQNSPQPTKPQNVQPFSQPISQNQPLNANNFNGNLVPIVIHNPQNGFQVPQNLFIAGFNQPHSFVAVPFVPQNIPFLPLQSNPTRSQVATRADSPQGNQNTFQNERSQVNFRQQGPYNGGNVPPIGQYNQATQGSFPNVGYQPTQNVNFLPGVTQYAPQNTPQAQTIAYPNNFVQYGPQIQQNGPYQPQTNNFNPPPPPPLPPPNNSQQNFQFEHPQNDLQSPPNVIPQHSNRPRPLIISPNQEPSQLNIPHHPSGSTHDETKRPHKTPQKQPHKDAKQLNLENHANKTSSNSTNVQSEEHSKHNNQTSHVSKIQHNSTHSLEANQTSSLHLDHETTRASNVTGDNRTTEGRAAYSTTISGVGPLGVYGSTAGGLHGVGLNGKPYGATHGNLHGASLLGSYGGSSGGLHGVGVFGKPYGASHAGLKGTSLLGSYGLKTGGVHGGELPLRPGIVPGALRLPPRVPGVFRRFRSTGQVHDYQSQYTPRGGVYQQQNGYPVPQQPSYPAPQSPTTYSQGLPVYNVHPVPTGSLYEMHKAGTTVYQQRNPSSKPQEYQSRPLYPQPPPVQIASHQTMPVAVQHQPSQSYIPSNDAGKRQYQQPHPPPPQFAAPQYVQVNVPFPQVPAYPQGVPQTHNPPQQPRPNVNVSPSRPHHARPHKAHHEYPYNFGEKDSKFDKVRAKSGSGSPVAEKFLSGIYDGNYQNPQTYGTGGGQYLDSAPSFGGNPNDGRQNLMQSRPSAPPLATLERLTNQRMELARDLLLKPLSAPLLGLTALLKASALGINAGGGLSKTQDVGNYKVLTGYNSHKYDHKGQDYGFGQPPPWMNPVQQVPYQPQYPTVYGAPSTVTKVEQKIEYPVSLGELRKEVNGGLSYNVQTVGYDRPVEGKPVSQSGKIYGLPYHQVHRDSGFDVKETTVGGEVVNLSDKKLNISGHLGHKQ